MPSFRSILKEIGQVALSAEHTIAPMAEQLLPQYAPIIAAGDNLCERLQSAIKTAEIKAPDAPGPTKAQAVAADFASGMEFAQSILALANKKAVWDVTKLEQAIAAQVAAYNAIADVKTSIQVVDLPPVVAKP